ncbi:MAG: OmcA/MtrC family decaheme c-type cytochrome [Nitrospiraceae bacterium]|nr:OmcA/MtrC family decaheme c-type cytochrome [Nitrospiraceae bacterium]
MIKRFRMFMLIISVFAAMGLIYGCGSSTKEGTTQIVTPGPEPIPAPDGNLQAAITGVTVNSPAVVTFTLRDQDGNPLDPNALIADTANSGRVRFYIAQIGADGTYRNYIKNGSDNPTNDSGGTFTTVSPGVYTYTFGTDITKNPIYNPSLTHTVVAQIQRNRTSPVGTTFQQAVNPYFNFRPDGQPVTVTREIVAVSNCNECHGKLGAHGGGRRDTAFCIICHNAELVDSTTGNSIDFKVLIHKIHMGKRLPSNKAGGDFTIGTSDFGDVTYPFMSGDDTITGTPVQCTKCHRQGRDAAGKNYGKDIDKYKVASKANCMTCHDTTSLDGGATVIVKNGATPLTVPASPHPGGVLTPTAGCAGCHQPTGAEFGSSITGAHTVAEQSSVFTGINFQILSVSNATPGNAPSVTFKVTDNSGAPVSLTANGASFNLKFGYAATDYTNNLMENYGQPLSQSVSTATDNGDGTFTMTFSKAIPANATGIGVVGMEGRKNYTVVSVVKGTKTVQIGGKAVQVYVDLATGAMVSDPTKTRRRSVDINKCNMCHTRLTLHGANRVDSIEECVICHNPDATDKGRRPTDGSATADGLTERSIHFKTLIHGIHSGENLSNKPFIVYGYGGSINDFSDITYPRDRRECNACHIDNTTSALPLPDGALGTTTSTGAKANDNADNVRIQPITATCTSCHDSANTATHVADKVSSGRETCLQCHTTGLLLGADNAHFPVR